MLGIILLGLAIAAVLLLLNHSRNQADRLAQLETQNLHLHERVQILEALVLEKKNDVLLRYSNRQMLKTNVFIKNKQHEKLKKSISLGLRCRRSTP